MYVFGAQDSSAFIRFPTTPPYTSTPTPISPEDEVDDMQMDSSNIDLPPPLPECLWINVLYNEDKALWASVMALAFVRLKIDHYQNLIDSWLVESAKATATTINKAASHPGVHRDVMRGWRCWLQ
ncbi:predicted protein [Histoplasma capsulatum var. duboisii H88]|uniref:Predicted protein n=1 Tax=Ajellomyces capsulatus (strain H88) TaxID=544711 RepID=F0UMF5_AJEC8|nr:predicted protein [Histoplasma capsulatum var. duboisii H88]